MNYKMGVLGLGVMGASLARNIESRGFPVVGYDLDAKKTNAFLEGPARADRRRRSARAADGDGAAATHPDDGARGRAGRQRDCAPAATFRGRTSSSTATGFSPTPIDAATTWRTRVFGSSAPAYRAAKKARCSAQRSRRVGRARRGMRSRRSSARLPPRPRTASPASITWGRGAGHYVKMVHNGIEHGDMQPIAETYDLLHRGAGLPARELADIFSEWNDGELKSPDRNHGAGFRAD